MKKIIILLALCLLIFSLVACKKTEADDPLVVGMELQYPPFEMSDTEGNPTGISVDLAHALGEYLGREVLIKDIAWAGLIPSLKSGKVDIIISSMTITEERKKTVAFSDPYLKSYLTLLLSESSSVEKISDLNEEGRTLALKQGTTGHIYAKEKLPKAKIHVFDKVSACILEVVQGKADAFIYDQMTVWKNWNKNKEKTRAILKPFQDDYEYWGMAMRQEDEELKKNVDAFIKDFKEKEGFKDLAEKYLSEIKKDFDKMGIPFFM